MSKINKNQESNLVQAEREQVGFGGDTPAKGPCGEILAMINDNGGFPVTINQSKVSPINLDEDGKKKLTEVERISSLVKNSRINFIVYKNLMDEILNCNPNGYLGNLGESAAQKKNRFNADNCECVPPVVTPAIDNSKLLTDDERKFIRSRSALSSSQAYYVLKFATEKFVNIFLGFDAGDGISALPPAQPDILPYIALIEAKLSSFSSIQEDICYRPLFTELIWNYWHEEGMQVNTINAIAKRFQNKKSTRAVDPLSNLTIDPLRPLNNLIWGYIQDSINRLTITRRRFEYDHHYGIDLFAAGASKLNTADSRSNFIQAFHNMLYKCSLFYKEADNLLKVPDAFPVLNALREVHLLLSEGADNQFGDLPLTARVEMLIEQYILARPEMREFLGGRIMVPYDEPWMDRVDTMKTIQGWPGASISYFHDLATFGEQIILSIRWISWSQINNRDIAKEWALVFRDAVQRYIHCYHTVTGVDLSDQTVAGTIDQKEIMPAFLLRRQLQRNLISHKR